MRHFTFFFLGAMLLFASCEKTPVEPTRTGPEPDPIYILATDSIGEGEMDGITIGSTAADAYAIVQGVLAEHDNKHLNIVRPGFTDIRDLQDRIYLYNHLLFDETVGTSQGVQVYFENDKIKSIWTNNGDQLIHWPTHPLVAERLSVGDPVSGIYSKLVKLSKRSAYASRFQRMSLFDKNAGKPYDTLMAEVKQWYFTTIIGDEQFYLYYLNFDNGILVSMKRDLMGAYGSDQP